MNVGAGVGLIAGGALLVLLVVFGLWRRLSSPVALPALAVLGALVGVGALLVQARASVAEWALTMFTLSVLTPVQARLVFGRPGPRR